MEKEGERYSVCERERYREGVGVGGRERQKEKDRDRSHREELEDNTNAVPGFGSGSGVFAWFWIRIRFQYPDLNPRHKVVQNFFSSGSYPDPSQKKNNMSRICILFGSLEVGS